MDRDTLIMWILIYSLMGMIALLSIAYGLADQDRLELRRQLKGNDIAVCLPIDTYTGRSDHPRAGDEFIAHFACWEV